MNLSLSGEFVDPLLGGGMNAFNLTRSWGRLRFKDAGEQALDEATTRKGGGFCKTVLSYQRQQFVTKNLICNFNFIGQLADKNLDASEKLSLGGADGVRAFPQGEPPATKATS